jgi:hypothetical protein
MGCIGIDPKEPQMTKVLIDTPTCLFPASVIAPLLCRLSHLDALS